MKAKVRARGYWRWNDRKVAVTYDSDKGWKLHWTEDEHALVIIEFWTEYLLAVDGELRYGYDLAGRAQDYRNRDFDYWALRSKVLGLTIETEDLYDVVVDRNKKY